LTGAVLFAGSVGLAVFWHKKYPTASFGLLWFFILLFPHSNLLVPTAGLLYEHWLYLPMVGFWLVLTWLIFVVIPDLIGDPDKRFYFWIPACAGMGLLLFIYAHKTIARNRDWHDPVTFYNQTLAYAPASYRIINNLGMAYDDAKNYDLATQMYVRSIKLDPKNPVAYHNLANTYKDSGRLDLARQNFETAINLDPHFLFSYYALAQLYLDQKNYDQAVSWLQKLLDIDPGNQTAGQYISQIKQLKGQ
jgi:hypothetical protein